MNRDTAIKQGQIAHLDHDASNGESENLAFLCFDHHDQYDSRTSQSKNYTREEVAQFRDELELALAQAFDVPVSFGVASTTSRAADRSLPGHYIRSGSYDSAEITVKELSDGSYHFVGSALWGKKLEFGPNIGELDFVAIVKDGRAEFERTKWNGGVYRVIFEFVPGGMTVIEENHQGEYGMNVTFGGQYERAI